MPLYIEKINGDVDRPTNRPTDQPGEYRAICLFQKLENRKKAEICNNAEDKDQDNDDDDGGGDDADPPGPPLHHFESCWPAQSWQGRPGKGPAPRDISPPWTVYWPLVVPAAFFSHKPLDAQSLFWCLLVLCSWRWEPAQAEEWLAQGGLIEERICIWWWW